MDGLLNDLNTYVHDSWNARQKRRHTRPRMPAWQVRYRWLIVALVVWLLGVAVVGLLLMFTVSSWFALLALPWFAGAWFIAGWLDWYERRYR